MLHKMLKLKRKPIKPSCGSCRSFHGKDKIVCAVHPYGPEPSYCLDHEPISSWAYAWRVSKKPRRFVRAFLAEMIHGFALLVLIVILGVTLTLIGDWGSRNISTFQEFLQTLKYFASFASLISPVIVLITLVKSFKSFNSSSPFELMGAVAACIFWKSMNSISITSTS
jgi:hypothetical protein